MDLFTNDTFSKYSPDNQIPPTAFPTKQASIRRSQSFYDKYANGVSLSILPSNRTNKTNNTTTTTVTVRCYFYNIDFNGNVYLEEMERKDRTSCVKDITFLNYLIDNMQPTIQLLNQQQQQQQGRRLLVHQYLDDIPLEQYPFVTYCGLYECNFIRPADTTPIVFHTYHHHYHPNHPNNDDSSTNTRSLSSSSQQQQQPKESVLLYGGTIQQPFYVSCLRISQRTGRLYHEITNPPKRLQKLSKEGNHKYYGLIRSAVSVTLSEHIVPMENSIDNKYVENDINDEEFSGLGYCIDDDDNDSTSSHHVSLQSSSSLLLSDNYNTSSLSTKKLFQSGGYLLCGTR